MLKTSQVTLRRVVEDDWESRYQWLCNPQVNETLSAGLGIPLSSARVRELTRTYAAESPTRVDFTILNSNEEPIGFVHLAGIEPWARRAELGICIGETSAWGQGLGKEVTRLIVMFGFHRLNLHKIWLTVDADNPRAIRCYEQVGFHHDGVLRDAVFKGGKYIDRLVMSVLRQEYQHEEVAK